MRNFDDRHQPNSNPPALFLKFVTGATRLPLDGYDPPFNVTEGSDMDAKALPKAHTCFFSINLPKYSSKQILKTKLEYAISECFAMDADFALQPSEASGAVWSLPSAGE